MDKRKYNRSTVPQSLHFLNQHGRMFANFGGGYILRTFSDTIRLTDGNIGEAWMISHLVWLSMDGDAVVDRQRIWDLHKAVPESILKPIQVATLARATNTPYETTKRYVLSLLAKGLCAKSGRGYVPSHGFMASQDVITALLSNVYAMHCLVKKLEQSGMLEYLLQGDFSALEDIRP